MRRMLIPRVSRSLPASTCATACARWSATSAHPRNAGIVTAERGAANAGVYEQPVGNVTVKMDGAPRDLWPDSRDGAKVGRLSLFVIKRSEKYGIRLKDPDREYRRNFKGIETYPAKEEYRVTAKW